jgi:hypothetical protein
MKFQKNISMSMKTLCRIASASTDHQATLDFAALRASEILHRSRGLHTVLVDTARKHANSGGTWSRRIIGPSGCCVADGLARGVSNLEEGAMVLDQSPGIPRDVRMALKHAYNRSRVGVVLPAADIGPLLNYFVGANKH